VQPRRRAHHGRDVDELGAALGGWPAAAGHIAAQVARGQPLGDEGRHLVVHQRDERRDHHGLPPAQQAGDLVAGALAAARAHAHKDVGAGQCRANRVRLDAAELVGAPIAA